MTEDEQRERSEALGSVWCRGDHGFWSLESLGHIWIPHLCDLGMSCNFLRLHVPHT